MLGALQQVVDALVGGYARNNLVEEVRRQITVVVTARVARVLPREGRVAVLAEAQRRGGRQARPLRDVPRVGQHGDGLVRVADARVAQLAVLITDVGVVVVVAEEVVGLLGRSLLRTALRGRGHDGQTQTVVVAEALLDRTEVGIGVVVDTVHIAVAALTRADREAVRPAVVKLTRGVGDHHAEAVELRGVRDAHAQALAHLRGAGVDVRLTGDAAQTVVRETETRNGLLVARRIVQTAPQRPGAVARHGVVEADAVQIDVLILRVVAAHVEAHLAEAVRGDVRKDILRRREGRRKRLLVGRRAVHVELGKNLVIEGLGARQGRYDHRLEVLHRIADAHHHVELLEVGRSERNAVVAGRQVLDFEVTVLIRRHRQARGLEGNLHVAQRFASQAGNHLAAHASVLSPGDRSGRHGEQKKE